MQSFQGSISISHAAALTRAITERDATVFHVFFTTPPLPSSSPLLILPELTPRDRGFPFDVADTHFLHRQTNKPRHQPTSPPPKKNPLHSRGPPLLTGENLRSAAPHFLGDAGGGRGGWDKTGNQKEASRDQASSKADLISTSEVLEMSSDVPVLEGVREA